jgi:hypothetical protein
MTDDPFRLALLTSFADITSHLLHPLPVAYQLLQKRILNMYDVEPIRSASTRRDQVYNLLEIVLRGSEEALKEFVCALRCIQPNLYRDLKSKILDIDSSIELPNGDDIPRGGDFVHYLANAQSGTLQGKLLQATYGN